MSYIFINSKISVLYTFFKIFKMFFKKYLIYKFKSIYFIPCDKKQGKQKEKRIK